MEMSSEGRYGVGEIKHSYKKNVYGMTKMCRRLGRRITDFAGVPCRNEQSIHRYLVMEDLSVKPSKQSS
jgi:hypothetical protein